MGIGAFFKRLSHAQSGNAAMLVGLGMPALIGGTGLAVDTAQWYLWKRELQYAVDQAAIAGAWARADNDSIDDYDVRAQQEFDANVGIAEGFSATPVVGLAEYNGIADNSVLVSVTASKRLPFSGYLTDNAVTIAVSAQATTVTAQEFTTCMLALDPDADSAFILGGSVSGSAPCGFGSLSDSDTAMVKNGNPSIFANQLISNGGIDSGFSSNGSIFADVGTLTNPFEGLDPPDDPTPRTYSCPAATPATTTTTADVTTSNTYNYEYYRGRNKAGATIQPATYIGRHTDYSTAPVTSNETVPNGTTATSSTVYSPATFNKNDLVATGEGSGTSAIWEWLQVGTTTTYSNIQTFTTPANDGVARPLPGTYANIEIDCNTEFQPGVYVVEGTLDFGDNVSVTGDDVMFVLKSGDKIHINDNSNLNFTGISSDTLENTYGLSAASASKLAGMLLYDPESEDQFKMNGRASLVLNGVFYMPGRNVWFNGNSNLTGSCLQIASGTITLNGNFNASIFCESSEANPFAIGSQKGGVRLVR